ncbi:MAG: hypothetical protein IJ157_03960 [Clostridia bacterium]|nr:hypothetical protein [Clostridia bacterium]
MGNYSKIDDGGLWQLLIDHQNEAYTTSGRGSRPGIPFTYAIRGGEMFVSAKEKSITKATVMTAYRNALALQAAEGCVKGPKRLGVPGAASYLYPVFIRLGICTALPVAMLSTVNEG